MALSRLVAGALLMASPIAACRSTSVCRGPSCEPPDTSSAAGEPSAAGGAAGEVGVEPGGGGLGGDDLVAAAGAAGERAAAPECELGRADCDGSRFTVCETSLSISQRHCGACGNACEGGCYAGECSESDVVMRDVVAASFVATQTFAFTVLVRNGDTTSLARIRLTTGEVEVLLRGVSSHTQLSLGADSVYVFDPTGSGALQSVLLDGSEPKLEELSPPPASFGASGNAAYYVDSSSDSGVARLWYRAGATNAWQQVWQGSSGELIASGFEGVAFRYTSESEEPRLGLLEGKTLIEYGPAPPACATAAVIGDAVVCLAGTAETSLRELWWLNSGGQTRHYPISASFGLEGSYGHPNLVGFYDSAALRFDDGKLAYLQLFNESGETDTRIGLPLAAQIAYLDDESVWFSVTDGFADWRFIRSSAGGAW